VYVNARPHARRAQAQAHDRRSYERARPGGFGMACTAGGGLSW